MAEELEYMKKYFISVDLKRVKILEEGIYLGMNLTLDPPRHVVLSRGRVIPVLQITEFTKYKLSRRFFIGKKNLIRLNPKEYDDLFEEGLPVRLNDLGGDFAEKRYLQGARI